MAGGDTHMSARDPYEAVGLAAAIAAVREEVIQAQQDSSEGPLTFRVGPVEMEFEVALTQRADYGGRLRVIVVTSGNDGGGLTKTIAATGDAATHRIRLTLEPRSTGGFAIE
jgi:hypothetical protein